jgi:FAD/FMN-containing dehydrogenase
MGGAASRIDPASCALGGRSGKFMLSIDTGWTDPAKSDDAIRWTRSFWNEMRTETGEAGAAYLNFLGEGEDSTSLMRASYGDNFDRLVTIKKQYDSTNLFRMNQNIAPR